MYTASTPPPPSFRVQIQALARVSKFCFLVRRQALIVSTSPWDHRDSNLAMDRHTPVKRSINTPGPLKLLRLEIGASLTGD